MSCYSKALDFDFKWDQGKTTRITGPEFIDKLFENLYVEN